MKYFIILLFFLFSFSVYSSGILGKINDPDGFSNVRENQSAKSKVLFKIIEGEYFYFEKNDSSPWFEITNMDGEKGFMHKSRIIEVELVEIGGKKYRALEIKVKIRRKNIGELVVVITQIKKTKYEYDFNCNSYLEIFYQNGEKKSVVFEDIQALGDSSGISFLEETIPNHLIVVKHGDYNGRTIIINEFGKIINLGGGKVSNIINERFIISFGECDLGFCSFSVYDLMTGNIVLKQDSEFEVYQLESKIIFELNYGNGEGYKELDTQRMQLINIDVIKSQLKYFDNFVKYDLKNGCLCS